MVIIRDPLKMQRLAEQWRAERRLIGFVPTMGALHAGHLSLIHRARRETQRVVVSIFVNPTQFGPREDYLRYPKPFLADCRVVKKAGGHVVFAPSVKGMYPDGAPVTWVEVERLSVTLCGPHRPGHFRGVATVVAKLFHLVQPHRAYFGEKDYQQMILLERMVRELHFPLQIVRCPTVREADGLTLSSRNRSLSPPERLEAGKIYQALRWGAFRLRQVEPEPGRRRTITLSRILGEVRQILQAIPKARIDYLSAVDPETLQPLARRLRPALLATAVWIGRTRLIDNVLIL